jgi:hypothetical protein
VNFKKGDISWVLLFIPFPCDEIAKIDIAKILAEMTISGVAAIYALLDIIIAKMPFSLSADSGMNAVLSGVIFGPWKIMPGKRGWEFAPE